MIIKNILPIGTVVKLENLDVNIIISGYGSVSDAHPNYTWDYSGFMFPIGYIGEDSVISFDAEQVEKIISYGYQDEEQLLYVKELTEALEGIEKGTK